MSKATCNNCSHWERGEGYWAKGRIAQGFPAAESGECRRTPPAVFHDPKIDVPSTYWPETYPGQWCGEWFLTGAGDSP
jgi:hypothetical protein